MWAPKRRRVLDRVVGQYITSGDFNGFHVTKSTLSSGELVAVRNLVRDGQLQVVGDADYLNPHIRPWASKRTIEEQLADLDRIANGTTLCLYPTPAAMASRPEAKLWPDQPYRERLAEGHGTLDLAYFKVDVVEQYRNDPRFHYWSSDAEVHLGIGDEAYLDVDEDERDKISSLRVGFAYDRSTIKTDNVRRFSCAFLCDLADLTPEHQQRWRTYEVTPNESTSPHPMWWAMQMGHWPDGMGPFERILGELGAIADVFAHIYGSPLFRVTERPREWGWVLRPSTQEWHQFLLATDKLLSESIDHAALTAAKVPRNDDQGRPAGTIQRLRRWLESTPAPPELIDEIINPLRKVRQERQKPAHALVVAESDPALTAQQRDLLGEVAQALLLLRQVLQIHPGARDTWSPPRHLDGTTDYVV